MASSKLPSTLTLHKDSHTIFKTKPKIRIIHIFAPEIINTDVHNFRDLVQRLTGKPPPKQKSAAIKKPRPIRKAPITSLNLEESLLQERVVVRKEEQEMWSAELSDNSGGFLKDFAYLDGFDVQELVEFPDLFYQEASSPYSSTSLSQNESF